METGGKKIAHFYSDWNITVPRVVSYPHFPCAIV